MEKEKINHHSFKISRRFRNKIASLMSSFKIGRIQLAATIVFSSVFLISAQTPMPKTVTDFYLSLPNDNYSHPSGEEIHGAAAITKYRKSLIKIEDVKNGYLRIEPNESEGWSEIVLFKKTDGAYLVAHSNVGCGPDCSGEIELLTFNNGQWTNVTTEFYPPLSAEAKKAESCYWKLPRIGRVTTMICGNDEDASEKKQEFAFEWNGAKFVRK